ncbi:MULTISPECIES: porin family protein [unclassified Arcicella]|uniref:porin family protein n=1 Tax=unclassified Arcicella TaxID=2644986 RepID=UPI0028642DD8|nr:MULTISPECIES: porin family protein [unclassified Arcicella]MDR6562826.1 opacity protein-like surface antigen [Arcicella sp. BE51]MDR6812832.1 opacity protein-like surface antigen [Arcicella sp. BE140]MDR6824144.1 opacity protein-like surface antigen [Arcicella sp. BE139]
MKRKILLLLVLFCLTKTSSVFAQFTFGIKGGVNFSQLKTDFKNQSAGANLQQSLDTKTGYVGGVYFRIGKTIFLQPELIFSAKGGSMDFNSKKVNVDYTSIDVPLLIGYKFGPLRLNAGPLASFKVSESIGDDLKNYSNNIGDSFKNASYGYQAGAGLDIGSLSVDLRYEGSLSDISNVVDLSKSINYSQKGNLWQMTIGLRVF